MPKKTKSAESQRTALDLLHGGKTVPEGLLRKHMADIKNRLEAQFKEKGALKQQVAKYWNEMNAGCACKDAGVPRAAAGLRGISDRLAKRKLVVPARPSEVGGILAGSYSLKITPPYDYASHYTSTGFGNPDASASADKNSGQTSCYVVSDSLAPSGGMASSVLGIFFSPIFSPAILQVSADPAFAFFWWIHSLPPDCQWAWSRAGGSLGITAFQGHLGNTQGLREFTLWDQPIEVCGQNIFDFGSRTLQPRLVQVPVDSNHFYVIYLMCWCWAEGGTWPGSRGVASLAATLPSITLDVQAIPILEA